MKRFALGLAVLLTVTLAASCSKTEGETSSVSVSGSHESASSDSIGGTDEPVRTTEPTAEPSPDPNGEETMIYPEVGRWIRLSAQEPAADVLVNNAGMSGSEGRIHLHDNLPEHMYLGETSRLRFDIGHIEQLGELYLWNYNEAEKTASGAKELRIRSSLDGEVYENDILFSLDEADGQDGLRAQGLEDRQTVDFGGRSARYIEIEILENYGGEGYGLSELRLYRYRQENRVGEYLSLAPIEQFHNGRWSAEAQDYNWLNGSGLNLLPSATTTHDNRPEHMLLGDERTFEFILDLQGQYPISELLLWNYNDPENLDAGLKTFRLSSSTDLQRWSQIGQYELPRGDGSDAMLPSLRIELASPQAHYLKLEVRETYGGNGVGLSEVAVRLGDGWYTDSAPDYTALFSNYEGWAGADGIYSVNLDGRDYDPDRDSADLETYFFFSDTLTGHVDGETDRRSDVGFYNNTSAILRGGRPRSDQIRFYYGLEGLANILPDPPIPATKEGKQIYYWLGDSFVTDNKLYVFSLAIDSVNTLYGFEQIGVDLARYDIVDGEVDFSSLVLINDQDKRLSSIMDPNSMFYFGGGVYEHTAEAGSIDPDGYFYIYGYNDLANQGRRLIVSRVLPESIEDFASWEYLDASGRWQREIPAEFMLLAADVAPELSVSQIQTGEYRGQFLLVWQHITVSPTIKAAIAKTPYGPFTDDTILFTHDTHLKIVGKANTTYNAKAHPALSGPGELLISYNINGGTDAFEYGDIYRPRFLRTARMAK